MKNVILILSIFIGIISLSGCKKGEMSEVEKERTEYVKETVLDYGMEINTEVTKSTRDELNKDTEDVVSFGKKQLYELSCNKQEDEVINTIVYHLFENDKKGENEAEEVYNRLKDSASILPNSNSTEENDQETGNKLFTLRAENVSFPEYFDSAENVEIANTGSTSNTSELVIFLIYDAKKHEVVELTSWIERLLENSDDTIENIMLDLGWIVN